MAGIRFKNRKDTGRMLSRASSAENVPVARFPATSRVVSPKSVSPVAFARCVTTRVPNRWWSAGGRTSTRLHSWNHGCDRHSPDKVPYAVAVPSALRGVTATRNDDAYIKPARVPASANDIGGRVPDPVADVTASPASGIPVADQCGEVAGSGRFEP
ncbi:hypothetical protein SAMN04489730_6384 [Amycolatopsis australiensis]|uniref:Uncharacterized protein n=1 Tax=Amycolatopsis australiensis TaxID=546364 RepID=A0A1K1SRB8_9PSEU|nr:hypothetical protein SAMN04489730_6384 [Amycolatopsis australiensis]